MTNEIKRFYIDKKFHIGLFFLFSRLNSIYHIICYMDIIGEMEIFWNLILVISVYEYDGIQVYRFMVLK